MQAMQAQATQFHRIAIVNRGESAVRLLHAVRETRSESGTDLTTIALFTTPDARSVFVRESDESYFLGTPTFVDQRTGKPKSQYLNFDKLITVFKTTRADAVWAGWGIAAEQVKLAEICDELGITFIGPPASVMRLFGNRISCKTLAQQAGLSVVPWSECSVDSVEQARDHAIRLGFPVMIKAAASAGHRGAFAARDESSLHSAFESARTAAFEEFGDATVFVEKCIIGARHLGVQVVSDSHGNTWALGIHDRTIQRGNSTVVAETLSPSIDPAIKSQLLDAAVDLANSAGFQNAGSVDCFLDPTSGKFLIGGVDTCLQLDHPVSEVTTGVDLVKLQLHVALGGKLEQTPPQKNGHAITVRLSAEDPYKGFAPAAGRISLFRIPTGPGIRVDTGMREGDDISSDIDPTIAKITAHGRSRNEAIARLRRALLDTTVVAKSGSTNKALLLELLEHRDFAENNYDVDWLDRIWGSSTTEARPLAHAAIISTAIARFHEFVEHSRKLFFATAARGRPQVDTEIGRTVELRYAGQLYTIQVRCLGLSHYRVCTSDGFLDVRVDRQGPSETWLSYAGHRHRIVSVVNGIRHLVEVDGVPHRVMHDECAIVRAPAPAVTHSVLCSVGDEVQHGDRLFVLEAMKTEMAVCSPCSGRVRDILVLQHTQVQPGEPLAIIEPRAESEHVRGGESIHFPAKTATSAELDPKQCIQLLTELSRAAQGFDITDEELRDNARRRAELCGALLQDDEGLWNQENEVLRAFADITWLFRRDSDPRSGSPSAEQSLRTYLRAIDSEGKGLSPAFLSGLKSALSHYGVNDLAHTQQLEDVLMYLHKSQHRARTVTSQVFQVLERKLRMAANLPQMATPEFRDILDTMIDATLGLDLPLNDLAREVRYRFFDRPQFIASREDTYKRVDNNLAVLRQSPTSEYDKECENAIAELVSCALPLVGYFTKNLSKAPIKDRDIALSIMLRRLYSSRHIAKVEFRLVDNRSVAIASFESAEKRCYAVATHATCVDLHNAVGVAASVASSISDAESLTIEIFTECEDCALDKDRTPRRIQEAIDGATIVPVVSRIVIAAVVPQHWSTVHYFTFESQENKFEEREVRRGIHPMLAERLELWRLSEFKTSQLRAHDDIYLFHAVAKDNPKDERLFSFVEIRDMSVVRDASGDIVQLPQLERLYTEALAGIRDFQSHRSVRDRLYWNRVILYIRPEVQLSLREMAKICQKLAPLATNLGLEKAVAHVRISDGTSIREQVVHISNRIGTGMHLRIDDLSNDPIRSLSAYAQKVVRMRRLGLVYPYEIIRMLTPVQGTEEAEFPPGDFVEYDIVGDQGLIPVTRAPGHNKANVIVGVITNYTAKHSEGMKRVMILGDPSKEMGALAEAESRLIIEALKLAAELQVPVEWFAVSSGAKISMEVGTEGLDWIAKVLRGIIEFTQSGGEINVIVIGVNVGGQSYWNAEATMLMHTKGILVMTDQGSMVLTGKRALEYSGGVSAEDNFGIGGAQDIMEPNGQAQYVATDLASACHILFRHYDYTYVVPGERFPRRHETTDLVDRDVCLSPHPPVDGIHFKTIGEVFSFESNPGRKKPFDIRGVMAAVVDQDDKPLERWARMRDAENAVVWDTYLGGIPVCMIGIQSRPVPRFGFAPADGPDAWTGGTLFPLSSKKVARAVNASSNNRPVVVLANLSGFDGSPESMRKLQLEYGSEIGRAVVNFQGPIVFCVISRYHGGAYVVFSRVLSDNLETAAIEGSHASVIGGAPASAVVFAAEVKARALADDRVKNAQKELSAAKPNEAISSRARYDEVYRAVFAEKQGDIASHFDSVHCVERAREVGSLQHIIPAASLRPYLIEAVERGIARSITAK